MGENSSEIEENEVHIEELSWKINKSPESLWKR